ncbi:MAG: hypothetical protein FD124_2109 [Alphaproteobacteria bacterium]|nr:MAG: hypothetical protein FD160_554 [Caulobacteraceae bacterium]TPW05522.1 MAG: hypothetical protein FD124_2109 [Alphaproteobacteria bacterium]
MTARKAAAYFHQFGTVLIAVAAGSFVVLPAIEIIRSLAG